MCFPAELYGTLQAFLASVSFSFGLLNYVLNPWTQLYFDGNYTVVSLLLGLPTTLFYGLINVVQGCEHHTVPHLSQDRVSERFAGREHQALVDSVLHKVFGCTQRGVYQRPKCSMMRRTRIRADRRCLRSHFRLHF